MSEMSSRQKPPSRGPATLAELDLIVRPPGNPHDIRVFTTAERADAEIYATEVGATVELLA